MLTTSIVIFLVSIFFLIASAKFFTQAAEAIGLYFGLSSFVVGIVIVSVGTSLPELVASIISVRSGQSEIVAGNILGSSLSNILFVLGLTALIAPRRIDLGEQYLYIDLNYLAGVAIIMVMIMYDGVVEFMEASVGLFAYGVYTFYLLRAAGSSQSKHHDSIATVDSDLPDSSPKIETLVSPMPLRWAWVTLVISGFAIYFSASKTVDSLGQIATHLGVSKAIVSLTLLSIGTTLPECVVSVTAARNGNAGMAVGNVLGSCIFNALVITGIASAFGNLVVPNELIQFSLPFYAAMMLFFYLLAQDKKVSSFEGALLLLLYVLFLGKLTGRL